MSERERLDTDKERERDVAVDPCVCTYIMLMVETVKVVLAKADAISCVLNAMRLFPEREELQRQACSSLLRMAAVSGEVMTQTSDVSHTQTYTLVLHVNKHT